jgi:hypothetical protein
MLLVEFSPQDSVVLIKENIFINSEIELRIQISSSKLDAT